MRKAFEVGFLTCTLPAEYGGVGLGDVDLVIVSQELAWGCAGMYTTMMANSLAFAPILLFGTDEQKKRFFAPFLKEMAFASYCLTEREAGSDTSAVKTTARQDGSGYIINRSHRFLHNRGRGTPPLLSPTGVSPSYTSSSPIRPRKKGPAA